jgi:hypothetical protein
MSCGRFCVPGLIAVLIVGCGGVVNSTSGGKGENEPTSVTLTFPEGASQVVAQIGSGAFALQTLSSDTLSLSIPSGIAKYAVVYLCPGYVVGNVQYAQEGVWEASTADGTSFNLSCPYNPVNPPTAMGALAGSLNAIAIPGAASFSVAAQNGNAFYAQDGYSLFVPNVQATNIFTLAPTGSDRVLLLVFDSNQDALAARNFNNQTVPGALNGGNTVVFGAGDETSSAAVTYNNVPSGFGSPVTGVDLMIGNGAGSVLIATGATTQYPTLSTAALESGDVYRVQGGSLGGIGGPSGVFAGTISSGGPVSFSFPAPWTYAGPSPAAQPTFTFDYGGFSGKTGVVQEVMYAWQGGPSGSSTYSNDQIELSVTANYGSNTVTLPDLSGLAGLMSSPASGTPVVWYAEIWQYNSGIYQTPPIWKYGAGTNQTVPVNSTWSGVSNEGYFTVP